MMLPILISASPAPGSYLFSAWTAPAAMHNTAAAAQATRFLTHPGIATSPHFVLPTSLARGALAGKCGLWLRLSKRHCWAPTFVIDARPKQGILGLERERRIGPRHPRLGRAGFHFARWLAELTMGAAGIHKVGSPL